MHRKERLSVSSLLFLLGLAGVLALPGVTVAQGTAPAHAAKTMPYMDASLPVERRVDDLISRMTLEEKVSQMRDRADGIPRLALPRYDWWNEGLHGVAFAGTATNFPQVIGMAATWDTPLVHTMAQTISTEARAKYNQAMRESDREMFFGLTFWAPNINIFRDPRWGRGQETYGEDPFLTGRMGVAFVTGMQGEDPKYFRVISTPKHYAVHSGPEPLRHKFNVDVTPHDLEDTYLPAFRAAVTEGHAQSVMCAYNSIDGAPACANSMLLNEHLRQDWKFDGYVVSDCAAVADVSTGHKYAPDFAHGAAASLKAGTDIECGFADGQAYPALVSAVKQGLVTEAEIDTAVKRLFVARMRLGMFDPPESFAYGRLPFTEVNSPEHRQLSLKAARESMVLLKNQGGLLPLPKGKKIAVIGPTAELVQALQGNYNGPPPQPVFPIDGMEQEFGAANVTYAQGASLVEGLPVPIARTALRTGNGGNAATGLKAEYYSNASFSGTPVLVRTDRTVNFNWDKVKPIPGLPRDEFSVRWSGFLVPPAPGAYKLGIRANVCYACESREGFRLYVDNKLLLEDKKDSKDDSPSAAIEFRDTEPHAIRLEYAHHTSSAGIDLTWQAPAEALRAEAVKVASDADVVVAFVGLSPMLEGEEMPVQLEGFRGGDRTAIDLPAVQDALLKALGATGKPLVVVLNNGSALAVNWAEEHAGAILEAWYPGEEGGRAIAQTLGGENNPGGRLPLTFYKSLDQLPAFEDYSMAGRTYRYFTGQPLYAFGYGLSYSKFAYSGLKVGQEKVAAGEPVTVDAEVRNASGPAGDEVVELYLVQPRAALTPQRVLAGFQRVHLEPGKAEHVHFVIAPRTLGQVDAQGARMVAAGDYQVMVGGSQPGAGGASAHFSVTGTAPLPK